LLIISERELWYNFKTVLLVGWDGLDEREIKNWWTKEILESHNLNGRLGIKKPIHLNEKYPELNLEIRNLRKVFEINSPFWLLNEGININDFLL
jgi:hypothetical protein